MVCPQRSWTRSWIFNSYIGVQLKKTAMRHVVQWKCFCIELCTRNPSSWTMQFAKAFLSIFNDLDNVSTLYMYILFSTDVFCVLLFIC